MGPAAFKPTVRRGPALGDDGAPPSSPASLQGPVLPPGEALHLLGIGAADALLAVVRDEKQAAANRAAALTALGSFNDPRLPEVVKLASAAESPALRLAALPIAATLSPTDAAPVLANLVDKGEVAEKKAAFETLGLVRRSYLHNGTCLYELTSGNARRYHVVCKACGRTDPLDFTFTSDAEQKLQDQGYAQISHVLEFFGVCPACQQAAKPVRETSVAVPPVS